MQSRNEIMNRMQKQIESFKTINYWEDFRKTILEDERFKLVHKVRNFNKYCYYISNFGRVLVIKDDKEEFKKEIFEKSEIERGNCWIIPIKNGYLENILICDGITLNTSTDVYNFMIEAGWLDNTADKELAEEIVKHNIESKSYTNDRIELHHIDNNPSNNSLKNLIWVPRSIHQTLHSKL